MGIIPKDKGIVKQVNIAMYNYQVEALDMLSEENGLGRSHYLRVIIDLLIKQYESKQEIEQRARELSKESEEEKIEKAEIGKSKPVQSIPGLVQALIAVSEKMAVLTSTEISDN